MSQKWRNLCLVLFAVSTFWICRYFDFSIAVQTPQDKFRIEKAISYIEKNHGKFSTIQELQESGLRYVNDGKVRFSGWAFGAGGMKIAGEGSAEIGQVVKVPVYTYYTTYRDGSFRIAEFTYHDDDLVVIEEQRLLPESPSLTRSKQANNSGR